MRAFALDAYGAPTTGSVRELPVPEPGEGQVRIRVHAAGVNPADFQAVSGWYSAHMAASFPLVPGFDVAGTVDALGPGVSGIGIGDAVFGQVGAWTLGAGTFAEYTLASVGTIAPQVEGMDGVIAAALPMVGAVGQQLVDTAAPQPGDIVVVIGATGGIGSIATQLLRRANATPIAVARSEHHEYARALGAVETIDYATDDVAAAVRSAHPGGIAGVLDLAGDAELVARLAELVREGGFVLSMARGADEAALAARGLRGANLMGQVTADGLRRVAASVADGTLRRPEITTVPLEAAGRAMELVGGRHARGKLVVVIGGDGTNER